MPSMSAQPRKLLRCYQCGYGWFERRGPVRSGPPLQCPSCHSTRWNKRTPYDPHRPRRRKRPPAPPEGGQQP
jgi:hypothetical protein